MRDLIEKLRDRVELSGPDVAEMCRVLMDEAVAVEERAALLEALSAKGETAGEIAWFVRTLIAHARPIEIASDRPVMDICGTGGDKQGLFNVSTAAMFLVAACGVTVVKHGNRGITSKCGGADVLEALGVNIEVPPERAAAVAADVGCVFLFAPMYHPAFKVIGPVRAALAKRGVATVFNKLGPLLNPASPSRQLAGVFEPGMTAVYAEVFRELGREKAWAVHGETPEGGMDEMSTFDDTQVVELNGGRIKAFSVCAQTCAIHVPTMAELRGGSAAENAAKLEALLRGKLFGPIEDLVCWNAAGALVVAGVVPDLKEGLYQARSAISGGKAVARLDALRRY